MATLIGKPRVVDGPGRIEPSGSPYDFDASTLTYPILMRTKLLVLDESSNSFAGGPNDLEETTRIGILPDSVDVSDDDAGGCLPVGP